MNPRPTRATTAGRIYLDLQNKARREHRPTDELHQIYALEGFLDRLTHTSYADRLVIKGGILLAAYDARRPTRDIDIQGQRISIDPAEALHMVQNIAAIRIDDGLDFDTSTATAQTIRDTDEYGGLRIGLDARLASARLSLHVDINVGDPIAPPPHTVALPRLLGGQLQLSGYPLPMILAEKIITALQRGTTNTRWRDFADIYILTRHHSVSGNDLHTALAAVARHRQIEPTPLHSHLEGYPSLAQPRWAAWRRRMNLNRQLPHNFADLLTDVTTFTDPALNAETTGRRWSPTTHTWT